MRKILSLSAAAGLALSLAACTSGPDKCIDDLDCGTHAYSEERTYKPVGDEAYKVSNPVNEAPMAEPKFEPTPPPAPAPEPEPMREDMKPIEGSADQMFDERLTK